jgi:hypothetical protein
LWIGPFFPLLNNFFPFNRFSVFMACSFWLEWTFGELSQGKKPVISSRSFILHSWYPPITYY